MFNKRRGSAYGLSLPNRNAASTSKAKKSSYLEMRFLISKQSADIIIGSNGCNIKRLHMEYCAMLNISGNMTYERILTVGGFDIPTMVDMLQDVIMGLKMTLLNRGFGENDVIGMLLDETEVEYITNVDDYQLNQILEDSGTHIDVFLMCCPLSSDRVIRIRGEPGCISKCVASLYDLLKWCPVPVHRRLYNPDNANEEFAADYGGFTNLDDLTEQAMDISNEEEEDGSNDAAFEAVHSDEKFMMGRSAAETVTERFSIQSSLVGIVFGQGESRLNQIRHESMAMIKLSPETKGSSERILTVMGDAEEVENATKLLHLCIELSCVRVL